MFLAAFLVQISWVMQSHLLLVVIVIVSVYLIARIKLVVLQCFILNIRLLTVTIKVKGVEGVIMSQVEDVVLQQSLVMRERVTVMVLMMVDNMMDMMAVKAL